MIYNKSQRRGIPRHKNKESKWNWGGHALSNSNNETKKLKLWEAKFALRRNKFEVGIRAKERNN